VSAILVGMSRPASTGWSFEAMVLDYSPRWSPLRVVEILAPALDGSPGGISIDTTRYPSPFRIPFVKAADGSTCPDLARVRQLLGQHGLDARAVFEESRHSIQ
jgi:hypothetical protein